MNDWCAKLGSQSVLKMWRVFFWPRRVSGKPTAWIFNVLKMAKIVNTEWLQCDDGLFVT